MTDFVEESLEQSVGYADEWRPLNEFAIARDDGSTITCYTVMGNEKLLLWDEDGKLYGPFDSVQSAKIAARQLRHDG
jgi:hypothetical protein